MRSFVVALVLAASVVLPHGSAFAAAPVVPEASECQADPERSVAVLFATPVTARATPATDLLPIASTGPAADVEIVALVTATVHSLWACANAGDFWALVTYLSDDYLRRSFVDGTPADPLAADLERFVNSVRDCEACELEPLEGEGRFAIGDVTNVRVLDDGRIGADVTITSPAGAWNDLLTIAFVSVDDRWLIDQIILVERDGTPVSR